MAKPFHVHHESAPQITPHGDGDDGEQVMALAPVNAGSGQVGDMRGVGTIGGRPAVTSRTKGLLSR